MLTEQLFLLSSRQSSLAAGGPWRIEHLTVAQSAADGIMLPVQSFQLLAAGGALEN